MTTLTIRDSKTNEDLGTVNPGSIGRRYDGKVGTVRALLDIPGMDIWAHCQQRDAKMTDEDYAAFLGREIQLTDENLY